MATDGQMPPPCDGDIFREGKPVAFINGRSNAVETWVKAVATARIDWHYSSGVAQVLYLGDESDKTRIILAMRKLASTLQGTILQMFTHTEPSGLYRAEVTEVPAGTIATYYDGGDTSAYIVEKPVKPSWRKIASQGTRTGRKKWYGAGTLFPRP